MRQKKNDIKLRHGIIFCSKMDTKKTDRQTDRQTDRRTLQTTDGYRGALADSENFETRRGRLKERQ